MKKLIISTVALVALTFGSCKKDNLQPVATSIEQQNTETSNDDKVDPRNAYVGKWKGRVSSVSRWEDYTITITKVGATKLKASMFLNNTSYGHLSYHNGTFTLDPKSGKYTGSSLDINEFGPGTPNDIFNVYHKIKQLDILTLKKSGNKLSVTYSFNRNCLTHSASCPGEFVNLNPILKGNFSKK